MVSTARLIAELGRVGVTEAELLTYANERYRAYLATHPNSDPIDGPGVLLWNTQDALSVLSTLPDNAGWPVVIRALREVLGPDA